MAEKVTPLAAAVQLVAEAKRFMARQHARIAKLKALGETTADAERALAAYKSTFELLQEHERMLRKRLH